MLAWAAPNTYSHREVFILCAVWILQRVQPSLLPHPPTPTPLLPFLWDDLDSLLVPQYLKVEVLSQNSSTQEEGVELAKGKKSDDIQGVT